jgi:hypothetical protein
LVGNGVLMLARTTCSPTVRPEVIWVSTGPAAPTVTRTLVGLPAVKTVTKVMVPRLVTADVGTVTASWTCARVMDTVASEPANRVGTSPVSPTVTG